MATQKQTETPPADLDELNARAAEAAAKAVRQSNGPKREGLTAVKVTDR